MASCITGPKLEAPATSPHHPAWPIMSNSEWTAFNPTRPLSPIFSPLESTTPTTAVPLDCPMDFPPRVPPKPCQATSGGSPLMKSSPTKSPSKQSSISSSPKQSLSSLQFNPDQAATRPQTPPSHSPRTSPSRVATTVSPTRKSPKPVPSALPLTSESLNSDRGRQIVRQRSKKVAAVGEKEETAYYASLPKGLTPMEAAIMLPEVEKETLRKHASSQAERYEVLGARHVANLSQVSTLRSALDQTQYLSDL